MTLLRKIICSLAVIGGLVAASGAQAVAFDVTGSFTPGAGYGVDVGSNAENGGTLLDVLFTATAGPQSFALNAVNDSYTFKLGEVNFREPNTGSGGNLGIRNGEQDALNVLATFIFTNPLGATQILNAVGTATLGTIADADVDFAIDWSPLTVNFGSSGQFEIDLQDLSFSNNGIKNQNATIKLVALPQVSAVPEPGSIALLGLGLAGLGFARRQRKA